MLVQPFGALKGQLNSLPNMRFVALDIFKVQFNLATQ